MIREYSIVLFGHSAVERAKASFEVGKWNMEFDARDCCRQGQVGILVGEHAIGLESYERVLEGTKHCA